MLDPQPIHSLKGIGEKIGKLFEKLGIFTIGDLSTYYPGAHDVYEASVPIDQLKKQIVVAVGSVLIKNADLLHLNHMQIVPVQFRDLIGPLQVIWFNIPCMRVSPKSGETYVFRGRVIKKRRRLVTEQPEVFSPEAYEAVVHFMRPVYGQTRGLSNKTIVRTEQQAPEVRKMEREYMLARPRGEHELAEINYALEHIHFPTDQTKLLFVRKRLVFGELFMFLVGVRKLKEHREDERSVYTIERAREANDPKAKFPYALTDAQECALEEMYRDTESGLVINRLTQGDVGSSKAIIVILALLQAACNGYQGVLMVPTEVLARRYLESITTLFEEQGISKTPVLVVGSMTAKEKHLAYEKIANHEADIIIGTHALIQGKVIYDNLVPVITDEQYRFGVGQRGMLSGKGSEPHMLVMSATPTPRTLAIIIYGDLDMSVIDELPAGRQPIKNCAVDIGYRPRAYSFIQKQVEEGHQAYTICPMVKTGEAIGAENVLDYVETLRRELPPSIVVEHLHGKMKAKEKNAVMERSAAGGIYVLVSTIVIEAGVSVPNVTVMMIENAGRLGPAQPHRLRGRVGRGKAQSYCVTVNCFHDESTGERLDISNRSGDGFYIALEDLKLHGPGDISGMRQSGDMEFELTGTFTDANILKRVSEEVNDLLDVDSLLGLDEHRELKWKIEDYPGVDYEKLNL